MGDMPDNLTIKEAVAALRITRETLWRWRQAGIIRVVKPVGRVLVPKSEIERLSTPTQTPGEGPGDGPVKRHIKKVKLFPVVAE